jgi:fumarylpyruvate hydrolase
MPSSISELNFVPGIRIPHVPRIPVGDDKSVDGNNTYYFPVNRIYCVGKNYSDHVKEMGGNPRDEAPCFFMKPSNAVVPCGRSISNDENSSVTQIEYPLGTDNLHYEVELVVAIGNTENGTNDGVTNVSVDDASKLIYGYGVGVDLTRRDLQSQAKKNGLPWCTSKGFDASAPISNIYPITIPQVYEQLHLPLIRSRIDDNEKPQKKEKATDLWLYVNGQLKQSGCPVHEMIWSVPEIISQLSRLYRLRSGDIIFTGTPAGVSRIIPNDTVRAGMNVLGVMEFVLLPNSHPVVTGSSTTVPGTL